MVRKFPARSCKCLNQFHFPFGEGPGPVSLFEKRRTAEQLIPCLEGFYRYELGGEEEYHLKKNLRHLTIQTFAGTVALKETSEYSRSFVIAYTNPPEGIR
jgi:hypothetical protein